MNQPNKVLACVDRSRFADAIADAGAWAASRMGAPLEFLHVIDRHPETSAGDDHSGAIGIDAQQHLLKDLSDRDAVLARQAREAGRIFLNRLRERALAAGVPGPDTRQRLGELEETLVEQHAAVDLFVLGRCGESAETSGRSQGRNLERLVRALHKPILTVRESFQPPQRCMIAFDGSATMRRGVEWVATSPLFQGVFCHVLMSGQGQAEGPRQLAWAQERLAGAGLEVNAQVLPGNAEAVITGAVQALGIDLLFMGAFNHSPLRRLLLGSRTNDLLRSATVPALLWR